MEFTPDSTRVCIAFSGPSVITHRCFSFMPYAMIGREEEILRSFVQSDIAISTDGNYLGVAMGGDQVQLERGVVNQGFTLGGVNEGILSRKALNFVSEQGTMVAESSKNFSLC